MTTMRRYKAIGFQMKGASSLKGNPGGGPGLYVSYSPDGLSWPRVRPKAGHRPDRPTPGDSLAVAMTNARPDAKPEAKPETKPEAK